jgi:sigma-B regulation protein RsbU (phosphoserine phosphatase)
LIYWFGDSFCNSPFRTVASSSELERHIKILHSTNDKKLLLVVDNEPAYIGLANLILGNDYKILSASSGVDALRLVEFSPTPDLILLDVTMPDMDGYAVCRSLKANPRTREIPVIFLTGQIEEENETRGFDAGAVDYIHKPFCHAVVKARVQTHIMLCEARRQLSRQLMAIHNELEMAHEIQLSILPDGPPRIEGLEIAARYSPMSAVAGDFYDFIFVDEKHFGVLIADVSGHGLPAALIASMLKIALSAQCAHASDPARVLSGLNQSLCGLFRSHYVTAAYVFVDLERKILSYAGAGHPPLLIWSKRGGAAQEFEENGLVLGPFDQAAFSSIQIPVETGDRLLLYTDGVLEFRNLGEEEFGRDRLRQFVEANHALSANHLLDGLIGELWAWAEQGPGSAQTDDITLVAIDFMSR